VTVAATLAVSRYGMRCASAVTGPDGGATMRLARRSKRRLRSRTAIGSPTESFDPEIALRASRVMQQAKPDVVSLDGFLQRVALTKES